jgi:ketosteroid isomerase-like protein
MSREEPTAAALTTPRYEEYVGMIRELWDAFNRADCEATVALIHPDIEMQDHPAFPDAEWHRGRGGARRWAGKLFESFGEVRIEPLELIPITDDTLVVMVGSSATGKRGGVPTELDVAALVTMREGMPARMALYLSKAEALHGADDALEAVGLSE